MLGVKYGFAQSMDCAAQTMDPYFARAIHGLHVHVHVRLNKKKIRIIKKKLFNFFNLCMCMACIHLRPVVYPRTGPVSEPGSPLVWRSHMRGCGYARLAPLLNRRPEDVKTPPRTETGS